MWLEFVPEDRISSWERGGRESASRMRVRECAVGGAERHTCQKWPSCVQVPFDAASILSCICGKDGAEFDLVALWFYSTATVVGRRPAAAAAAQTHVERLSEPGRRSGRDRCILKTRWFCRRSGQRVEREVLHARWAQLLLRRSGGCTGRGLRGQAWRCNVAWSFIN